LSPTDTTSFPLADFARSVNSWLRTLVFLVWKNSPIWEFDDSNQTTLPIATTSTVASQQDYSLPSNALDVQRVEILNNSEYQVLKQFDKTEIPQTALTEFYEVAGDPIYYDVIGNSVMLYPKPSSVTTLKLYLARDIVPFTTSSTTTEPGTTAMFHPYLAYGSALDYSIARNLDANKVATIRTGIALYENMVEEHASLKNRDYKTKLRPRLNNSI
jgi:hypothetical protein